jgi:hypothetical protein
MYLKAFKMLKTYKINLFHDERDIWTESSLSPFVNIEPIYVQTNNDNFIKNIYTMIIDYLLNDYEYIKCQKTLTFKYYNGHYTNECYEIVEFKPNERDNIINFLCEHSDLCSFQISTGKYWAILYISVNESNIKGAHYENEEIYNYIKEKIKN